MSEYLSLIYEGFIKESDDDQTNDERLSFNDIKKLLTSFASKIDDSTSIYEAFRNFVSELTVEDDIKLELMDTIAFCESENADLEECIIKIKIALDNFKS